MYKNKATVLNYNGYLRLCTGEYVHRLIAIEHIPNPDNLPCINHIDGKKLNNDPSNLEWCTYSQNNKHAYDIELKCGANRKLNSKQIRLILSSNETQEDLSLKYGVAQSTISKIKNRLRYTKVKEDKCE